MGTDEKMLKGCRSVHKRSRDPPQVHVDIETKVKERTLVFTISIRITVTFFTFICIGSQCPQMQIHTDGEFKNNVKLGNVINFCLRLCSCTMTTNHWSIKT